jgi:hypothetical protein
MSGIKVPGLGSVKDKILRRFMDHETRRKLKSEQINWTIATMAAGEENRRVMKELWEELVALELGGEEPPKHRPTKDEDEERWLKEYEAMKSREVRLVRKNEKLSVEGL